MIIPNIWKNHPNVPNHQPEFYKSPLLLVKSPFSYGFPMVFLWFYQPVKFPAIATYCAPPEGWGRFGESAPQRASPRCLGGTSTQSLRTATGATGAPGWIDGVYWILMGFLL